MADDQYLFRSLLRLGRLYLCLRLRKLLSAGGVRCGVCLRYDGCGNQAGDDRGNEAFEHECPS